jgi:hypothetical protein
MCQVLQAVRYPDPEAHLVSRPTPRVGRRSDGIAHFKRHEHSLKR